eukprot:gb/GECG01001342.1/.p1 GENE.gb/GECG01001342.1/~~gb/GECG01001342.1/.p1  ORF type:complete len:168 (+),score=19.01 gb/GECG01001342.1/:1-504(+)
MSGATDYSSTSTASSFQGMAALQGARDLQVSHSAPRILLFIVHTVFGAILPCLYISKYMKVEGRVCRSYMLWYVVINVQREYEKYQGEFKQVNERHDELLKQSQSIENEAASYSADLAVYQKKYSSLQTTLERLKEKEAFILEQENALKEHCRKQTPCTLLGRQTKG